MDIRIFGSTHTGRVRSNNEDAYGVYPELSLCIVADGLGGHAGGEVASTMAVEEIKEGITASHDTGETKNIIVEAIKAANSSIIRKAETDDNLHGMGTTVVVVRIEGDKAIVAHVGDSRAYIARGADITRITKDHTVVEEYVRLGLLSAQETALHPYRHVLSRALGTSGDVDIDVEYIRIQTGDTIILCTDGLTNMLPDKEILYTICELRPFPEKITERLTTLANNNGGVDNTTIIAICVVND